MSTNSVKFILVIQREPVQWMITHVQKGSTLSQFKDENESIRAVALKYVSVIH